MRFEKSRVGRFRSGSRLASERIDKPLHDLAVKGIDLNEKKTIRTGDLSGAETDEQQRDAGDVAGTIFEDSLVAEKFAPSLVVQLQALTVVIDAAYEISGRLVDTHWRKPAPGFAGPTAIPARRHRG